MLEVNAARRLFHRGQPDEKVALDGLDLSLASGDFAVVIGSNGAGKSTLLNAISGALLLDSGSVAINGRDVTAMPVHRRAAYVARVFQDPMKGTAAPMTIAENMLLAELRHKPATLSRGLTKERRESYREQLSYLRLGLESRLDTVVATLSGGQRQSLSLVMAVSGTPDLLLLGEHTAALDPRTSDLVMEVPIMDSPETTVGHTAAMLPTATSTGPTAAASAAKPTAAVCTGAGRAAKLLARSETKSMAGCMC